MVEQGAPRNYGTSEVQPPGSIMPGEMNIPTEEEAHPRLDTNHLPLSTSTEFEKKKQEQNSIRQVHVLTGVPCKLLAPLWKAQFEAEDTEDLMHTLYEDDNHDLSYPDMTIDALRAGSWYGSPGKQETES
ncbi:hypothetical protein N7516_010702 [Penicillium verrucosum]|uniref:uncharacterized protein n=1 Tax=Penicillium verrucosum TaxID=60171 RepID=UPI002544ED3B|nr:uncharacterized protein N7516_010702 [Penicillium verrucosum]KAJ5922999.1 hypothetical protein N7516_010702 [Penicillium verrucosum]